MVWPVTQILSPTISECPTCRRMQQKKAEWLVRGHGEVEDVEEKEFFKVRCPSDALWCLGHA